MTLCQTIFMELGRKEATFFGMPKLPLVQIPHHPSGGARPGEHAEDARIAIGPVRETLTDAALRLRSATPRYAQDERNEAVGNRSS